MRVLVVAALEDAGYRVVEATDGAYMVELVRDAVFGDREKPDLIVLDVQMPKRTGLWILRTIRHTAEWDVPVIVMTAFADPAVREEVAALRSMLFDKPLDLDELGAAARKLRLDRAGGAESSDGA